MDVDAWSVGWMMSRVWWRRRSRRRLLSHRLERTLWQGCPEGSQPLITYLAWAPRLLRSLSDSCPLPAIFGPSPSMPSPPIIQLNPHLHHSITLLLDFWRESMAMVSPSPSPSICHDKTILLCLDNGVFLFFFLFIIILDLNVKSWNIYIYKYVCV